MLPAQRAREVHEPARGQRWGQPLARFLVDALPRFLGDRRVLAQQVAHRDALRLPMPSDALPVERRAAGGRALDSLFLGLLAVLDDVALLEQDPACDLAPERRAAQEEFEIHAEVLELLSLRVAHDRKRLAVGLDGESLLVPADRLGLLGQRGAQPREGPRLGRQLIRWLVILVGTHRGILSCGRGPSRLRVSIGQ